MRPLVMCVASVPVDHPATPDANVPDVAKSVAGVLSTLLFILLALVYSIAGNSFGCSGGVSTGNNGPPPDDPNRALGTYAVAESFGESDSRIFFGYWFNGDNDIPTASAQAFRAAIVPIENTARVTVVPSSILYEETAVSINTGQIVTVSVSGTWVYDGQTRIRVNWGSAFVTASTFPSTPPFDVATVGTLINGPEPNDLVFAEDVEWLEITNVEPGPLDGVFIKDVE